mgnify:CR=1 FL=1
MSQEALIPFKNEEMMKHQKDMKEQFFQDLENLENGTRDLMGEGNVTAIYIRLIEELNEIDEIYTAHLKSLYSKDTFDQDTLKTQEE